MVYIVYTIYTKHYYSILRASSVDNNSKYIEFCKIYTSTEETQTPDIYKAQVADKTIVQA